MPAKVSIIVPVYNAAKALERCLDSLRAQTLRDIEIILVDDGSTDGSDAICDRAAGNDSRIRVIHLANVGPARARNCGIEAAGGEYIGFADADDRTETDMYEQLYKTAVGTDADMAVCDFCRELKGRSTVVSVLPGNQTLYGPADIRRRILPYFFGYTDGELADYKRYCPFADTASYVWTVLYRTRLLRQNGLLFPSEKLYYTEDNLFNLLATDRCRRLVYLPKPLYHYLEADNSFTGRFNERFFTMRLRKYEYLRDFIGYNRLDESFYHRLANKICAESISIIDYYAAARKLSPRQKLGKIRDIAENGLIVQALAEGGSAGLPLSAQKVFLHFLQKKKAGILLALSEGYVSMVKIKGTLRG